MKNSKKRAICTVTSLLIIIALFAACGGSEPATLEGTRWTINGADADGVKLSKNDIVAAMGETIYEFKSGGVVTITHGENSGDGTYTQNGKDGTITNPGTGVTVNISIGPDTFTYEQDGVVVEYKKG